MRVTRRPLGRFIAAMLGTLAAITSASRANAADYYLTPLGAGQKDGSGWEQAFDQSALSEAVNNKLQPGDRLLLGSGTYPEASLTITSGGSAGKAKVISGVDRGSGLPVFSATWNVDKPDKGRTGIRLEPGASHLKVEHLRMKGYTFGVLAPPVKEAPARQQLAFDDIDMEQLRHGFYLSDCDDLQHTDCDLKRYTKHGFRLDQGCDRVSFERCTADCSEGDAAWEEKTELLPFGFTANDGGAPNTAIRFTDCLARNNMKPNQTNRYKNGDGFVVEGNSSDVAFERCRAIRNQDGGFDLKVVDVRLTDCLAIGNKRGFRIWTTGTLTNCFAGWDVSSLWNNGGPMTATRCTFYATTRAAVLSDDHGKLPITLQDCIVTTLPAEKEAQATLSKVVLSGTIVTGRGKTDKDPEFVHPDPKWDGLGDAMNSKTYPDKGYHGAAAK